MINEHVSQMEITEHMGRIGNLEGLVCRDLIEYLMNFHIGDIWKQYKPLMMYKDGKVKWRFVQKRKVNQE